MDAINCRNCEIILSAAGAKNVDPTDFRVIEDEEETTEESVEAKARRFEEFMKQKTLTYRPPAGGA